MKLTFLGHACFIVTVNGKKLLFDPFVSGNPLAKHIDVHHLEADYILISHGHADHLADAAAIAKRTGATLIAAFEVTNWFQQQGIEKVVGMNLGGKCSFDFGTVKCVTAHHSSALPDGTYGGNPMGFVIASTEKNFYYSGDTALTLDMQLIPQFAVPDFCILPIGDHFTMGPEDAARAAHMINCSTVVGVHYNTFPPIEIDTNAAKTMFANRGLDLLLPAIGETIDL